MTAATVAHSMSLHQLASRDYYVRISRPILMQIVFVHVVTVQAPFVYEDALDGGWCGVRAGYTEWQARYDGSLLSLGWDWLEMNDGDVRTLHRAPPRTNLKVVDAQGYDVEHSSEADTLWNLIETISWRVEIHSAVRAGG